MFTTLEEAIQAMKARFEPAGRTLAPWPVSPGATEQEVRNTEVRLGVSLPPTFRRIVLRYDFLNAVAGNVSMIYAKTFQEWLVEPNVEPLSELTSRWWVGANRPQNLLLIAQSDAHSFLLDLGSGEVKGLWNDVQNQEPATVARGFPQFYQGLASVYLRGLGTAEARAEASMVAETVGADPDFPFWDRFANQAA